jgi:hypothetical protein
MKTAIRRTLAATVITLSTTAFAGCNGESPTTTAIAPTGASYDGGATFGSGSRDGETTTTTTSTTTVAENTAAADTGSAARGGATFGSGN